MKNKEVRINSENLYFFFKGRVALYAILQSMEINKGDEVILPGFTCVAVSNAIIYLGAKPVYVDIDPETYNIDPFKIEEKITKKTKAIISQHTFGIPADMDKILDIAKRHNLFVIEDSCHALGSKYKGKQVGSFGDAAFFSSQWSKPITTGLGGWAKINNQELLKRFKKIYSTYSLPTLRENLLLKLYYHIYSIFFKPEFFWFAQDTYRFVSRLGLAIGSSSQDELKCDMPVAYQKKMSRWQEVLLSKKISKIDEFNAHRMKISFIYKKYLGENGINQVNLSEDYDPIFLRYPIKVRNKVKILIEARKQRIELGDWFVSPVHPLLDGMEKVNYIKGCCKNAEKICGEVINLPTHVMIEPDIAVKTIDFLAQYIY